MLLDLAGKEWTWDAPAAWDRLEVIEKRDEQHEQPTDG